MNVIPGNPEANLQNILAQISQAKLAGHDGIVFPEMAIPGYLLGDEWENESFVRECILMNQEIIEATIGKFTAIWGNVSIDEKLKNEDGRMRKYNSAFIASDGKLVSNGVFDGFTHKTLMPKYRLFDDERHFYSLSKLALESGKIIEKMFNPFEIIIDGTVRKV
jgi:NAD+ synthase (glutamine-hydrolysing)